MSRRVAVRLLTRGEKCRALADAGSKGGVASLTTVPDDGARGKEQSRGCYPVLGHKPASPFPLHPKGIRGQKLVKEH